MKKRAYADYHRKDPQIFFGLYPFDQREFSVQISVKKKGLRRKDPQILFGLYPLDQREKRVYADDRRKDPQIFVRLAVINEKLST